MRIVTVDPAIWWTWAMEVTDGFSIETLKLLASGTPIKGTIILSTNQQIALSQVAAARLEKINEDRKAL